MRPSPRRISRRVTDPIPHGNACRCRHALIAALALGLAACGGSAPPPEPVSAIAPGEFSGARAWADLEALAKAPRPLGSEGAEAARSQISTRLTSAGIAVETITTTAEAKSFGPLALTHIAAKLPGA